MREKNWTFSDAIKVIGGDIGPADWRLEPSTHSKAINEDGAELKALLLSEKVNAIADAYNDASGKAKLAQKEYKDFSKWAIYASAGATIIGSFVLFLGKDSVTSFVYFRELLLTIQVILIAVQISLKYKLQNGRAFSKWQVERSNAESFRIDLFNLVCLAKEGAGRSNWQLQLQLEYFVRYQLAVQLKFYKERGLQHEEELKKYVNRGTVLTFFIALGSVTATSIGVGLSDTVGVLAIAGLIAPVLITVQGNLSLLNQDQRNYERYKITHANLRKLRGKLDEVRDAAKVGNRNYVEEFMGEVNALISVEHKQWKYDFKEQGIEKSQPS